MRFEWECTLFCCTNVPLFLRIKNHLSTKDPPTITPTAIKAQVEAARLWDDGIYPLYAIKYYNATLQGFHESSSLLAAQLPLDALTMSYLDLTLRSHYFSMSQPLHPQQHDQESGCLSCWRPGRHGWHTCSKTRANQRACELRQIMHQWCSETSSSPSSTHTFLRHYCTTCPNNIQIRYKRQTTGAMVEYAEGRWVHCLGCSPSISTPSSALFRSAT